jgi:hypothetical protein
MYYINVLSSNTPNEGFVAGKDSGVQKHGPLAMRCARGSTAGCAVEGPISDTLSRLGLQLYRRGWRLVGWRRCPRVQARGGPKWGCEMSDDTDNVVIFSPHLTQRFNWMLSKNKQVKVLGSIWTITEGLEGRLFQNLYFVNAYICSH